MSILITLTTETQIENSNLESLFQIINFPIYLYDEGGFIIGYAITLIFVSIVFILALILVFAITKIEETGTTPFYAKILLKGISFVILLAKTIYIIPIMQFIFLGFKLPDDIIENYPSLKTLFPILSSICLLQIIPHFLFVHLYQDSYFKGILPWCGIATNLHLVREFFKISLAIASVISFPIGAINDSLLILNVIGSLIFIVSRARHALVYDSKISAILLSQEGSIMSFTISILFFDLSKEDISYSTIIVAFFIGCTMGWLALKFYKRKVEWLMYLSIYERRDVKDLLWFVFHIYQLSLTVQSSSNSRRLLNAVIANHREKCNRKKCRCQKDDTSLFLNDKVSNQNRRIQAEEKLLLKKQRRKRAILKPKQEFGMTNVSNFLAGWFKLIRIIFEDELLPQFTDNTEYRLFLSYFYTTKGNCKYMSLFHLLYAQKLSVNVMNKYSHLSMLKRLDSEIINKEKEFCTESINIDLTTFKLFNQRNLKFESLLKKCAENVTAFWALLLKNTFKINYFFKLGKSITYSYRSIYTQYLSLLQLYPNHLQTYKKYGTFLKYVIQNQFESAIILEKGEVIKKNILLTETHSFNDQVTFNINSQNAILMVSGEITSLGNIISMNQYVTNIFGYLPDDLIDSNVSKIMPQIFASRHESYLSEFAKTGKSTFLNSYNFVIGMRKDSLLVPLVMIGKTFPGVIEGLQFIAFISNNWKIIKKRFLKIPFDYQRKTIHFILCDKDQNILSISKSAAKTFRIPLSYCQRFPSIFQKIMNLKNLSSLILIPKYYKRLATEGIMVKIHFSKVEYFLHRDYMNEKEAHWLKMAHGYSHVHFMECKTFKKGNVECHLYYFMKLTHEDLTQLELSNEPSELANRRASLNNSINSIPKDVIQHINAEEDENSVTQSVIHSSLSSTSLHSKIKEISLKLSEQNPSRSIQILKILTLMLLMLLLLISLGELIYYKLWLGQLSQVFEMEQLIVRESAYMTRILTRFETIVSVINGLENNTVASTDDRVGSLKDKIDKYDLFSLSHTHYELMAAYHALKIGEIENIMEGEYVLAYKLHSDSSISQTTYNLPLLIENVPSLISTLLLNTSEEDLVSPIIKRPEWALTQTLVDREVTENERNSFFILINGGANISQAYSDLLERVQVYSEEFLDDKNVIIYIIGGIPLVTFILLILIYFPFVRKIGIAKSQVIFFFFQLTRSQISTILLKTKHFSDSFHCDKVSVSKLESDVNMRLLRKNNIQNIKSEDFLQFDEQSLKLDSEEEEDEYIKEQREKSLKKYEKFSKRFWAFLIGIMIMSVFHILAALHELSTGSQIRENFDMVRTINKRLTILPLLMLEVCCCSRSQSRRMSTVYGEIFYYTLSHYKSNENKIFKFQYSYPSNQKETIELLFKYNENNFCESASTDGAYQSDFLELCGAIENGIFNYGFRNSIQYWYTILSQTYRRFFIENDISVFDRTPQFAELKIMMNRIILPTTMFIAEPQSLYLKVM